MKEVTIPKDDWLMNFIESNEKAKSRNIGTEMPDKFDRYLKIFHSIYIDKQNQHLEITWDEANKMENEPNQKVEEIKSFEDILKSASMVGIGTPEDLITSKENYRRVLWEELCNKENIEFKKTISPRVFQKHYGDSFPIWLCGPNEGSLDELETPKIIEIISQSKTANEEFYFHFDWLKSELMFSRDQKDANIRFKGKINELMVFFDYNYEETNLNQLPTYIWNESKSLLFWSDYDLAYTFIGCDVQIANQLMNSNLESAIVDKDFEFHYDKYWT